MRTRLLVLFFALWRFQPATAQSTSSPDSVLHFAQRQNWYIRAVGVGASLGEGRIRELRTDTLILVTRARIPYSVITGVDHRLNTSGGGTAGALTGAVLIGALSYSFVTGLCESQSCHEIPATFAGAVAGFALGGVIGEILNPAKHAWVKAW